MNRLAVGCLALLMACGAAWSAADAQQQSNNGHHYGWRNRDRHHSTNACGNYGGQYNQNGQYGRRHRSDNDGDNDRDDNMNRNGQYGGQYGQYGNCAGQYGNTRGNAVIRGTIVSVNGNQVTIDPNGNGSYGQYGGQYGQYGGQYGQYGQTITINDQPALDNRASGRVTTGRYVTAYGYWQNGVFYATQMN